MMKKLNILFKSMIILLLAGQMDGHLMAQEDSTKPEKRPLFSIRYFNQQNQIQFLQIHAQVKTGRVFEALAQLKMELYLDDAEDPENKIASLVTDAHGKAFTYLPPALKDKWKAGHSHIFIAKTDSVPELGPLETELEITKARMTIETAEEEESRQIKVKLEELQDSVWTAVPDVEMKIGIKRQGSMLPVGEDESYTTDSTGYAIAEYAVDSIPGDANGNIFLIARIEDHDLYGNLEMEKEVAWGKAFAGQTNYGKRSLWATGDKVPLWLMSLAVVIILSVWSTLLFLIFQVFKIRRLGMR